MWYQQFCGCGATSISDGIIVVDVVVVVVVVVVVRFIGDIFVVVVALHVAAWQLTDLTEVFPFLLRLKRHKSGKIISKLPSFSRDHHCQMD